MRFEIVEQVIRYNLEAVYEKRKLKPDYASITCSTISNIPYNLIFTTKFNDSSILITIPVQQFQIFFNYT
jgi:hypothetical protein